MKSDSQNIGEGPMKHGKWIRQIDKNVLVGSIGLELITLPGSENILTDDVMAKLLKGFEAGAILTIPIRKNDI